MPEGHLRICDCCDVGIQDEGEGTVKIQINQEFQIYYYFHKRCWEKWEKTWKKNKK